MQGVSQKKKEMHLWRNWRVQKKYKLATENLQKKKYKFATSQYLALVTARVFRFSTF